MAANDNVVPKDLKIGFIGAGKMAHALSTGFVHSSLVSPKNITISDPNEQMREAFAGLGVNKVTEDNCEVVKQSELVVISVKPNMVRPVLKEVSPAVLPKHLIVSIAAGVPLSVMEELLPPGTRVIRLMPNTPCLVQAGATVMACGSSANKEDCEKVRCLLNSVGMCQEGSEKLLDAVTGLSGSGPAYAYTAIEAMADGGVKMGLPREMALKLAAQTLMGAAKMVVDTGKHPGQLKDEVCSPGGTTITAIHVLEKQGFRSALIDAVETATLKAKELGKHN